MGGTGDGGVAQGRPASTELSCKLVKNELARTDWVLPERIAAELTPSEMGVLCHNHPNDEFCASPEKTVVKEISWQAHWFCNALKRTSSEELGEERYGELVTSARNVIANWNNALENSGESYGRDAVILTIGAWIVGWYFLRPMAKFGLSPLYRSPDLSDVGKVMEPGRYLDPDGTDKPSKPKGRGSGDGPVGDKGASESSKGAESPASERSTSEYAFKSMKQAEPPHLRPREWWHLVPPAGAAAAAGYMAKTGGFFKAALGFAARLVPIVVINPNLLQENRSRNDLWN